MIFLISTQILAPDLRKMCRVMVFCNTMDSCRAIEHTLTELGVPTLCYHGEMPIDQRKETIKKFSGEANYFCLHLTSSVVHNTIHNNVTGRLYTG